MELIQDETQALRANISIQARNLSVYSRNGAKGKPLLSDISFDISQGQFVAIVGSSGCGKSTLIKALAGAQPCYSGNVLLSGQPVQELREHFPLAIGYLPQFGAFHPNLSVKEILENAMALRLPKSVSLSIKQDWMKHIIKLSGVSDLISQHYSTLSGGQMRRIALAEALISDPAFLFLDELTSGLDVYSDHEMMLWLRDLAHTDSKTVVLVTHSTYHLHYCDAIIFLDQGHAIHHGAYDSLLEKYGVDSIAGVFEACRSGQATSPPVENSTFEESSVAAPPLKTSSPPSGFRQFPTLLSRQAMLFWRDRGQLGLHLALIITFPLLVAVFAVHGLPQVRNLTLSLEPNVLRTLQEQLFYLKESFHAASIISGLTMFQVVLLTLIGANNGAREIAKEDDVLKKELRAGLSPSAYVITKFLQIFGLCLLQSFWMAWFVKFICGFPAHLIDQFLILFAAVLAMSTTCLAISAAAPSPERASLLAIYLVGFQLPLSGAALALPDWLSTICRPFIVAYWGWSGYLQTFQSTRHYDIVKQSTHTAIATFQSSLAILLFHIIVSLWLAVFFVGRKRSSNNQ